MTKKQQAEWAAPAAEPITFDFIVRTHLSEVPSPPELTLSASEYTLRMEFLNPDGSPVTNGKGDKCEGEIAGSRAAFTFVGPLGQERLSEIADRFKTSGSVFMLREGLMFLRDILEHVGSPDAPEDRREDAEEMVEWHVERTEEFLKRHFGLAAAKKRNGRGQWTKADLNEALKEIRRSLPREQHTFPKAAAELQRRHPGRGASTGAALRALCDRLGLKVRWLRKREGKVKERKKRT